MYVFDVCVSVCDMSSGVSYIKQGHMHGSCKVVAAKTAAKVLLGNGITPEFWICKLNEV